MTDEAEHARRYREYVRAGHYLVAVSVGDDEAAKYRAAAALRAADAEFLTYYAASYIEDLGANGWASPWRIASLVCRMFGLDELRAIKAGFRETRVSLVSLIGRRGRDPARPTGSWSIRRRAPLQSSQDWRGRRMYAEANFGRTSADRAES